MNEIADIEAAGTTTIAAQMTAKGWTPVTEGSNIYYWPTQVSAGANVVVFDSFTLADNAAVADYANAKITIQAGIVQADGFATAQAAWEANTSLFTPATTPTT